MVHVFVPKLVYSAHKRVVGGQLSQQSPVSMGLNTLCVEKVQNECIIKKQTG